MKNVFWGRKSFFWDHWYPCCGLLVMSALGFKARMDSLVCILCHLHETDSSDSPLVRHLLTSWQPAWQLSCFIYILVYKHWWGSSLRSSMALPHNIWQDRGSTDSATPAWLLDIFSFRYSFRTWRQISACTFRGVLLHTNKTFLDSRAVSQPQKKRIFLLPCV